MASDFGGGIGVQFLGIWAFRFRGAHGQATSGDLQRLGGPGQDHSVLLDLSSGTALVSSAAQADDDRAPFAVRGLKVSAALAERIKSSLPKVLARQGHAADEAGIAVGSDLVFFIEAGGRVWRATYSIQTGAVTGAPADSVQDNSTRKFLTQLHMSHGYPSRGGVRTVWAIGVDLMFVAMVFWGLSGLFMWWQIKAVRLAGGIVLLSSLVAATFLAIGMHSALTGP